MLTTFRVPSTWGLTTGPRSTQSNGPVSAETAAEDGTVVGFGSAMAAGVADSSNASAGATYAARLFRQDGRLRIGELLCWGRCRRLTTSVNSFAPLLCQHPPRTAIGGV